MSVYCPKCGSDRLDPQSDPQKIDEEIDQILMIQAEKCMSCGHEWIDQWWSVWTPKGFIKVSVPFDDEKEKGEQNEQ